MYSFKTEGLKAFKGIHYEKNRIFCVCEHIFRHLNYSQLKKVQHNITLSLCWWLSL